MTFNSVCRRRQRPQPEVIEPPFGGGSGGDEPAGGRTQFFDGLHTFVGNQIHLMATQWQGSTTVMNPNISLFSPGTGASIEARAQVGVRISTGEPGMPDMSADHTNGVQIAVGDPQSIRLERGMAFPVEDQMIELAPTGITISAGSQILELTSLETIKIAVAGGVASITLTAAGIVLQGPLIQIN